LQVTIKFVVEPFYKTTLVAKLANPMN